ncbi:MAG: heme exporter protein CcmB [Deltaproteobacteria bacterium]|nr:heme exporter protein CcmB [Deltaproteobacteria bacterium]
MLKRGFYQVLALVKKDLLLEFREVDHLVSLLLFGFLLLLLFSFALSVEPDFMRKMAPGLFWMTILFSSLMMMERSFQRENEGGQWEGLLLTGADPKVLYVSKMLSNLLFIILIQVIIFPLMVFLFDLSLTPSLWSIFLLGSLGISSLGTTYGGLTATLKGGGIMLPLLLFPMLIPVLLASVKITELTLAHDIFSQREVWFKLLILFDSVFLLGSILLSDVLFDRS